MKPSNQIGQGRVPQLDALRGIAAATVVWHHFHNAFSVTPPQWWLYPLVAGHEAVILFFVLSGYVLSLPVWTDRQPGYAEYLVRRVCRIYLPYLAAVAVAALGCWWFLGRHVPGVTYWFYLTWQQPVSARMLLGQALMDPAPVLNTAFWSLRYELQMSMVFPLLCWAMLRLGRWSGVGLMLVTRGIAVALVHAHVNPLGAVQTFYYATFFLAGATLARERGMVLRWVRGLPRAAVWAGFALSLAGYFFGTFVSRNSSDFFVASGACGLIMLAQDARLRVGLRSRLAEYLGRISYSSYLVHGTVLFVLLDTLQGRVPMVVFAAVYAAASLLAAHLFCVTVEEPAMRLGKRIAGVMRRRSVGHATEISLA